MTSRSSGSSVMVIPTYNEIESLGCIVGRLRAAAPDFDVLIVDDDSPDGTGRAAQALAAADPAVSVLLRAEKTGLGAAYLAGFRMALDRGYHVIGEMDADGSHQPEQLPRLVSALCEADLVIGSRWVRGGAVGNWPLGRRLLSRGGNLYARALLGLHVHDATAGFRLYRREALEKIDLDTVDCTGYVFQVDLARRAAHAGLRVVEVPIDFVERELGESKMSPAIAVDSLQRITRWGARERTTQLGNAIRARVGAPRRWR